ncbi:MAG: MCE family protein [Rhodospirillales bacterium]|nr:MAG: MCE family protein [Rhodospirillales bacterium]
METRASFIIVGAFVILGMIGLLAGTVWITGHRADQGTILYDIYFDGDVAGLRSGNPVQYRGIPVGAVTDMRIDPENVERVLVTIEIREDVPIKQDTQATLALQGITGIAYIQLTGGTQDAPFLKAEAGQVRPVIGSVPPRLAELLDAAPELLQRAIRVVAMLEELMGPDNRARIEASLRNIEMVTAALADETEGVGAVVSEVGRLARELREAAAHANAILAAVEGNADPIMSDARATAAEARRAVRQLAAASEQLAAFLKENREPLSDFSATGLYEFSQLMAEARVLVAALSRLTAEFERDPARFLFGDQQQGVEVK